MNTTPNVAETKSRRSLKTRTNTKPVTLAKGNENNATVLEQSFSALGDPQAIVEHLTVPGFLRLIDHRWHLNDVARYGSMVGKMADALHISYIPAGDASLGILRMFPEPLLRRVYDNLAPQCGWPIIVDVDTPELEDAKAKREAIKANDRTLKRLAEVISETDDLTQVEALRASVRVIEARNDALRGEPAVATA